MIKLYTYIVEKVKDHQSWRLHYLTCMEEIIVLRAKMVALSCTVDSLSKAPWVSSNKMATWTKRDRWKVTSGADIGSLKLSTNGISVNRHCWVSDQVFPLTDTGNRNQIV